MKLQLALDGTFEEGLQILTRVRTYIDIVEVGTPLIFREGVRAVALIRRRFPSVTILADLKVIDAGEHEAEIAFSAGADLITVLGIAPDSTVQGALHAAQVHRRQVMADLMQVRDIKPRGLELLAMGCDYVCLHLPHDLQKGGASAAATFRRLHKGFPPHQLALAGGIRPETIDEIVPFSPGIVIVGKGITSADNPEAAAKQLATRIKMA